MWVSQYVAFKSTSDYGSNNPHLDDISIAEPPSYPSADISTEVVDFGVIRASETKTEAFSVNNTGGAALSWTALSNGSLFQLALLQERLTLVLWQTYL